MAAENQVLNEAHASRRLGSLSPRTLMIGAGLLAIAGAAGFMLSPSTSTPDSASGSPPSQLARLMAEYAAQLDSATPLRRGRGASIVGASAVRERLVLRMRLDGDVPADQLATVEARIAASDASELCQDPEMRLLIEEGGTIERRYAHVGRGPLRTETRSCAGQAAPVENPSAPMAM